MKMIQLNELMLVSGGCPNDACQESVVNMISGCSLRQMHIAHAIIKTVLTSNDFSNTDEESIKAILIEAISQATF